MRDIILALLLGLCIHVSLRLYVVQQELKAHHRATMDMFEFIKEVHGGR